MPRVVVLSFWRQDAQAWLAKRAEHLLSKTGSLRFVWVVGPSDDGTPETLERLADLSGRDVTVVRSHETGAAGDPAARVARLSEALTCGLAAIGPDDDYALIHESDLVTPPDAVERFVKTAVALRLTVPPDEPGARSGPPAAVAGWVTLDRSGRGEDVVFYDTWAYRGLDGVPFTNWAPYHRDHRTDRAYEVSSVGSCWLFPAQLARGVVTERYACLELCRVLASKGVRFWVDPSIPVVQPTALWVSRAHAPVGA